MKKILFGMSLMLFGFFGIYLSVQTNWAFIQLLSILFPLVGLGFAIIGFSEKGE